MVQKEGKWSPHSKFDTNALGSALLKAEEIDGSRIFDAVKVMKIAADGAQKEMWLSPHLKGRAEAAAAAKVRAGLKETNQKLEAARKAQGRMK